MGTITVANLGKAYRQYPSRWSRLAEWLIPGHKPRHTLKWVLQDINFTVAPGEAVGIIGINGAGKSTLLKMITGTTQPTTGCVGITGRVAALLELGMGFHPDFTGRQNAVMAGQLLGYTVDEIARLMPEIEAFAEIGDYIDQPVRVYSSGMQMRLAFSVATGQRPDVLIVDEALSVGDAYFQHKSFDRIRKFREQGTTLLLVSHDKQAIQSICDRAILLNAGRLAMQGEPEAVMDYYNAMLSDNQNQTVITTSSEVSYQGTESGTFDVVITYAKIKDLNGNDLTAVSVGQSIVVHLRVLVNKDVPNFVLGCGFKDRYGQLVFGTNTNYTGQVIENCKAGDEYAFEISYDANFGVGTYSLIVGVHASPTHLEGNYHWIDRAAVFNVINVDKKEFAGLAWGEMNFHFSKHRPADGLASEHKEKSTRLAKASYGHMFVYESDAVIGASLLATGGFQEQKIKDVVLFLKERHSFCPEVFVDIGANIGTHSVYALKSGLFKRGVAFEPDDDNFRLLAENLRINGISDSLHAYKKALSDRGAKIEMELSNTNYGDHRICHDPQTTVSFGEESERALATVECTTLDAHLREHGEQWRDCLIWMDTQGHEGQIFRGGTDFFSKCPGTVYVVTEFWPYGLERSGGKDAYFGFLEGCARIFDLGQEGWQEGEGVGLGKLQEMYREMLSRTEKEYHPHTDLLLIVR